MTALGQILSFEADVYLVATPETAQDTSSCQRVTVALVEHHRLNSLRRRSLQRKRDAPKSQNPRQLLLTRVVG